MPVVQIEFDDNKVEQKAILDLSKAAHEIVSSVTGIEDVPVYTNSSQIKIEVSPIEIFVQLSAHKITDPDKLIADLKAAFSRWKQENNFPHPINLTLIPMNWKIEIGI